jgi:hypothetical protein
MHDFIVQFAVLFNLDRNNLAQINQTLSLEIVGVFLFLNKG